MLEDVPAYLENSLQLIECLKSRDNTTNTQFPYPFSLDVVSLYTSIPLEEAIENIINRISTSIMSLTKEDIKELLIVTSLTCFSHSILTYSARLKDYLWDPVYRAYSPSFLWISLREWPSYHTGLLASTQDTLMTYMHRQSMKNMPMKFTGLWIKHAHPKIKFEIEKPTRTELGLSLSLLDFNVTITDDGNSTFEFYKKPAKNPTFVHHKSAQPLKFKNNIIRNERNRISQRCTASSAKEKHNKEFDNILRLNGYS